ncbi:MAG TPA: hypothetical protein VFO34_06085 [Candidatus Acidoferrales bacterium]|nr:hypothetical protein [Candidatus Acidoferrales bacterium]
MPLAVASAHVAEGFAVHAFRRIRYHSGVIWLGLTITLATVGALVIGFLRHRTRPLPVTGWLGIAAFAVAAVLMLRHVEPFATWFTPIAWTCYILVADSAVFAISGHSRLRDSPLEFALLWLLSIPLWLVFEAYNLRLANWTYVGLPAPGLARDFGFAWSFATITPGIFETSDLVTVFKWFRRESEPLRFSPTARAVMIAAGAAMLLLPVLLPERIAAYLFVLVWLGFIFLLDPVNHSVGLPSLLGDFERGHRDRFYSLLLSGWICGWLWESWNYKAVGKWHYVFPILQDYKIFEMPAPGFLGFLPFALECFTMYTTARWILRLLTGAGPAPRQGGGSFQRLDPYISVKPEPTSVATP